MTCKSAWVSLLSAIIGYTYAIDDLSSRIPSDFPSLAPSDAPSMIPTSWPILGTVAPVPSVAPSEASDQPSLKPSYEPTALPSESPVVAPSSRPSKAPSSLPTASPTEFCRDDPTYTSPFNDLPCYAHSGTSCVVWMSLGLLSADQVVDLMERCPVSCGVDCWSLQPFDVQITYRLNRMDTFMDDSTAQVLGDLSIEYLTEYFHKQRNESHAILEVADLRSQDVLGSNNRRLVRSLQDLVDLKVKVAFRGYAVGLDEVDIISTLSDGVESAGYSRVLQASGDPSFEFVQSSVIVIDSEAPLPSGDDGNTDDGTSAGGIAAAVLMSAIFSSIGATYYFRTRKRRLVTTDRSDLKRPESIVAPSASTNSGDVYTEYDVEELRGTSRVLLPVIEQMSTETSEASVQEGVRLPSKDVLPSRLPPRPNSERSLRNASSSGTVSSDDEQEHPFSNIIPPMIVYNNIDEALEVEGPPQKKRTPSIVPSKTVDATKDLVAALNDHSRPFDNSTLEAYPGLAYEDSFSLSLQQLVPLRPLDSGSRSSSMPSVNSEPRGDEEESDLDLRIVASEGSPRRSNHRDLSHPKELASATKRRGIFPSPRLRSWASESSISLEETNSSPKYSSHSRTFSSGDGRVNGHSSDEEKASAKSSYSFLKFMSPLSPTKKPRHTCVSSPLTMEAVLPPRPPSRSGNITSANGGDVFGSADENHGTVHHIQGPRKGKLGIIVQCDNHSPPTVAQVKDYSPLLGKIMPGDQIIHVNDVETSTMSCDEILALLSSNRTPTRRHGASMQIVVLRPGVGTSKDHEDEAVEHEKG